MKLVSVIIPCYRQARFLGEAIESVLFQTNLNFLDEQQNCVFVYGCVKLIAANGSPLKIPEQTCIDKDHYLELLRYNYIWTPAVIMFRLDVFESGICYEPSLVPAEDWDLYL